MSGPPPRLRYRCHACQWFAPQPATETFTPTGGACWRFPPQVSVVTNANGETDWSNDRPYVDGNDGCGEWQAAR
jgi:hypothetical protein